ncbi:MAG: hypothetical protein H3C62_04475 [Gemmatimonadaceae bacterium]|nr:hypothetical protein [Gemmatimonadaceae bacterium]
MIRARSLLFAARAAVACAVAALIVSCGRDAPAPMASDVTLVRHGFFSFDPIFPRLVGGRSVSEVVEFEKVRVVLHRADGTVALDTTVLFPVGADSVVLAAAVPLSAGTGNSGENFKLDLGYMNAAGEVVFKGGPVDLTVVPKGSNTTPPPVQIPVTYSGPGSTATGVLIAPRSIAVTEGGAFQFSAQAKDANGAVLPATPIFWASLDPSRAVINTPSSGAGVALNVRGTARIVAQLLNGPADTVVVTVSLVPRSIAIQGGNDQRGIVGTALTQPIAVKVSASDGVGAAGVSVSFAVATGGGSVANSSVTTDANGMASTTWTLGSRTGEQTVTASSGTLTGSPLTFRATARSVAPVRLIVASEPPATVGAGSAIPVTIHAVDAQGDVAKTFTGDVTLALGAGSPDAPLLGTVRVAAVDGVATFTDVRINKVGKGYTLAASANGLTGVTTAAFEVIPGPAKRLEFGTYPVFGATAGTLDVITVIARDAAGNVASGFTGKVDLSLFASPTGAVIGGPTSATAVAGVATFEGVQLTLAGEYQFAAAASGVTGAKGPVFVVSPGPASRLFVVSGSGQTADVYTALAKPIAIGLMDRFGNRTFTAGLTVTFSASDGGSASPSSKNTDAAGEASVSWTLGSAVGTQTLTASHTSLGSVSVTATGRAGAVTDPSSAGDLILIDDVNALDNYYGTANAGNTQFIKNLVGFTITGTRASANQVLAINDGNAYYNFSTNWTQMKAIFLGEGYTTTEYSGSGSHSYLLSIPSNVKLVIINNPVYTFSVAEINGLKAFAAQGGRILFVGENPAYYYETYRTTVENDFLAKMGSSITVVGSCDAPGEMITNVAHQVTTGIARSGSGSIYMNCASYHVGHGANDTVIGRDSYNNVVLSAVKVNTTPLPMPSLRAIRALQAPDATPRPLGAPESTVAPKRRP